MGDDPAVRGQVCGMNGNISDCDVWDPCAVGHTHLHARKLVHARVHTHTPLRMRTYVTYYKCLIARTPDPTQT